VNYIQKSIAWGAKHIGELSARNPFRRSHSEFRCLYYDRIEAGRVLEGKLSKYAERSDVVVLGLPRGGVPVAFQVAEGLKAQLDILVVRKLGAPGNKELAMGAVASGKIRVLNQAVIKSLGISDEVLDSVATREERKVERRERRYRGNRAAIDVEGKAVILIDDGLATGSTMRAAILALRRRSPGRIIVAVPVASLSACAQLEHEVDEILCAATPEPFFAVGRCYEEFSQTSDRTVCDLLQRARKSAALLGL
jgi:putative phosphoribosyl transferase